MEKNEPTQNKYDAALAKYNTQLDDAEIAAKVAKLIAEKVPGNHTEEVKKFLFHCIDLTTLNTTDSDESVMKFTQKVNQFDNEFPDLKNVAAICVYPNFAEIVKDTLEVEDVKIACVSAGFPSSQTFTEVKVAETAMALMEGADEIDIVISVGRFLSGDDESMCEEIQELKDTFATPRRTTQEPQDGNTPLTTRSVKKRNPESPQQPAHTNRETQPQLRIAAYHDTQKPQHAVTSPTTRGKSAHTSNTLHAPAHRNPEIRR